MKKTTLSQVAAKAGVSITTASVVLNPGKTLSRISIECAQRVRDAARILGYVTNYHAQSMKLGRSGTICIALDIGHRRGEPHVNIELGAGYFGFLLGAIEFYARKRDYLMTIIGPTEELERPNAE